MTAGWTKTTLGDVLIKLSNGVNCKQNKSGVGVRISRIESIADGKFDEKRVGFANLTSTEKSRYRLKRGDILFSHINSPPHVGKVAIFETDAEIYHGINLLLMRPETSICPSYLFYFLTHLRQTGYWEMNCKKSVNQASVNQKDISKVAFAFPNGLEEQRRIVAVLDEAFAAIAQATANAENNLANARELAAVSPASQTEDALRLSIGELLERGWLTGHMDGNHGGDYPRKEEFVSAGVTYLSANCIRDGLIDFTRAKFLSEERARKLRKGFAKNRDVLFAHNATVGPVALLETSSDFVILGTSLTYYRCNEDHIVPEYLASYLRSSAFVSQYESIMRQSTRNQVPITKQREFFVDLPTVAEQRMLVEALKTFEDEGRSLARIYQEKLQALAELKKSLLHRAFTGELTATPELALA